MNRTTRPGHPDTLSVYLVTAPGAEAQVDFFRGAPTLDAATGEWRRPWVFRLTLGHSRHGYEEAVWDQKLETFLGLHERAFRDLGGVPAVVRHDNLKAAVVRACFYDPDTRFPQASTAILLFEEDDEENASRACARVRSQTILTPPTMLALTKGAT
jgi:transposase